MSGWTALRTSRRLRLSAQPFAAELRRYAATCDWLIQAEPPGDPMVRALRDALRRKPDGDRSRSGQLASAEAEGVIGGPALLGCTVVARRLVEGVR